MRLNSVPLLFVPKIMDTLNKLKILGNLSDTLKDIYMDCDMSKAFDTEYYCIFLMFE